MRNRFGGVALRVTLLYAFFAALWVGLSGWVLPPLVRNPVILATLEAWKGWGLVIITSLVLYAVLRGQMRWVEREIKGREQIDRLARENQARFVTVFHSSPLGIVLSRPGDGRIVDANPAFLNLVGYSREEVIDRTSEEIGLWVCAGEREGIMEALRTRGRLDNVEFQFRKKSGDIGTALISGELISTMNEDFMLSMTVDITDRKRVESTLRESESRFRGAFEASAVGMALVSPDGRLLKVNRSLCDGMGYTEAELVREDVQGYYPSGGPRQRLRPAEAADRRSRSLLPGREAFLPPGRSRRLGAAVRLRGP
jgi:PAS domain S-box-containing protein